MPNKVIPLDLAVTSPVIRRIPIFFMVSVSYVWALGWAVARGWLGIGGGK